MKKLILSLAAVVCGGVVFTSCEKNDKPKDDPVRHEIHYTIVSAEQGRTYFTGEPLHGQVTPLFLAFMMERNDATSKEWVDFSYTCIKDGSSEYQQMLDNVARLQNDTFRELGINIAGLENIQYINMTMENFKGVTAFTSSTRVYANMYRLLTDDQERCTKVFWHELWHIISRNNPDLRKKMYGLLGFHVLDHEIEIPEQVRAHILCNPDVERHDSYATFTINGEKTDCMLMLYADVDEYEEFDNFLNYVTTRDGYWLMALDPQTHRPYKTASGEYAVYNCKDASDFAQVMSGGNTGYCDDPEECIADNFAYAMMNMTDLPNQTLLEDIRVLLRR